MVLYIKTFYICVCVGVHSPTHSMYIRVYSPTTLKNVQPLLEI